MPPKKLSSVEICERSKSTAAECIIRIWHDEIEEISDPPEQTNKKGSLEN